MSVITTKGKKPITHFNIASTLITHKANWEHIGLILATKEKLRNTPLPDRSEYIEVKR